MTRMEWLEDRLRHVRRVRSNGEDKREGKLVGVFALWGHHQVEFETATLEEAIKAGLSYETRHQDPRVDGGSGIDEVVLTKAEYNALHRDRRTLAALVQAGVYGTDMYEQAQRMLAEDES